MQNNVVINTYCVERGRAAAFSRSFAIRFTGVGLISPKSEKRSSEYTKRDVKLEMKRDNLPVALSEALLFCSLDILFNFLNETEIG